jgi:predicted metal-dependent phosphoesterase TrpH
MYVATDLHGHTRFSDGRATPEGYVELRRELGMRVIAIADHDLFAAVRAGAAAAHAAGMAFLPAAEITSFLHFGTSAAEQVHVLAYFPPDVLAPGRLERTFLYRRGERVQAKWRDFALTWLDALPAADRDAVDPDRELEALPAGAFPALQSMIDRIVARARPLFEAFRDHHVRFWEDDRETFGWTPEDAIDAIRQDGAIDIVAHPARYRDKERTAELLYRATGLEVYTSRHKEDVAAKYRLFAEANGKLWTASADDHQNARDVRPPCGTPVRTLERMMRRPLPLSMILGSARGAA